MVVLGKVFEWCNKQRCRLECLLRGGCLGRDWRIEMVASLDHIGKKYEWIRGTSFPKTLDMIERLNGEVGVVPKVIPTVSYFNILDIPYS